MGELIQIEKEHLDNLADEVERQQRELETERALRVAAEETGRKSSFKNGGFEMFNRQWVYTHMTRESDSPDWIKVAMYCHTHHRKDGHCPIDGDFGKVVLGRSIPRQNVKRLIDKAIKNNWLAESSNRSCLVAPWGYRFMTTDPVWSDCDRHV